MIVVGILASVALPRFFKVTERARTLEAKNMPSSIRLAQFRYFTHYQNYAMSVANLDIDISNSKYFNCSSTTTGTPIAIGQCQRTSVDRGAYPAYIMTIYETGNFTITSGYEYLL